MRTALANTAATFTAMLNDEPVGMVRLIGDGGMSFYIKDFAVVPSAQSQGVGHALLADLERYVQQSIAPGWAVSLELISSQGAVGFYERHGFEVRPNEWDGPGMFGLRAACSLRSTCGEGPRKTGPPRPYRRHAGLSRPRAARERECRSSCLDRRSG